MLSLLLALFSQRLLAQESRPPVAASAAPAAPLADGDDLIHYRGQVPSTNVNFWGYPTYHMVCPNVVDGINGSIATQPFQFSFQSKCLGNLGSMPCRARPNSIWTIHYYTETGIRYTEQWQDQTSGNYSNVRFYLYDRMPLATSPTSGQATQAGGNSNLSRVPYPNQGRLNNPYTGALPLASRS